MASFSIPALITYNKLTSFSPLPFSAVTCNNNSCNISIPRKLKRKVHAHGNSVSSFSCRSSFHSNLYCNTQRGLSLIAYDAKNSKSEGEDNHAHEPHQFSSDENLSNFPSSFRGKTQVLEFFFHNLKRMFGEHVQIVVKPTPLEGMNVGIQWKFEWNDINVPLGKDFSLHIHHTYHGKAVIRNIEILMKPLLQLEPFILRLKVGLREFMEKIDSTKWGSPLLLSFCFVHGLLMSLAIEKSMGFDDKVKGNGGAAEDDTSRLHEESGDEGGTLSRYRSESSVAATEDDDDDEERKIELGPQCTLKEQLEKDKDDESLRRWKEQLLGSVDINSVGETLEPDVKFLSLAIKTADRADIVLPIPEGGNPKGLWFTLKEGSRYSLMFTFQVENNIVSGLKYTNTVWKTGIKVDSTKEMIGTFSPQAEPYTHEMPEETTPSGMFAKGTYSAKSKFVDDDNKCYLEINYTFDIRKDWQ
ncbi:hypothetical protein RJT34_14279 [Clitoria ternatea]|uniref:Rho GDP-dissociation inhibitor 1 n=1 Tax=Clitoria ternatea TaxID=43366 RepID=A0AAN9JQ31_CLITE